jgi:hypothetical protein
MKSGQRKNFKRKDAENAEKAKRKVVPPKFGFLNSSPRSSANFESLR